MNENNLPEHILNKENAEGANAAPIANASVSGMQVTESDVSSNTMFNGQLQNNSPAPAPLPGDSVHQEYATAQAVTVNTVTSHDSASNQNQANSVMGGEIQHKKRTFNTVMTSLFIVWMLLGGYYFFGGNFDFSFLQGNLQKSEEFAQELPDFGGEDLPGLANSDEGVIDLDFKENTADLDSFDRMFLSGKDMGSSDNKVKGVEKSYADNISYANYDTDGDGLADTTENVLGTNYQIVDTDGDGLSDYQEVGIYRTDPLSVDTDGDGDSDDYEILKGTNPLKLKY